MGLDVIWGVGGKASDIHGYHMSYLQAREALKYKLLRNRTVFFCQETSTRQGDFQYPHDELQTFYNSILSMDSNKMQLSLHVITEQIEKAPTLFIGTSLFYDILNTAMKASLELDHSLGNVFHLFPELSEKDEIQSPAEILEMVDSMMQRLITHVEQTVSAEVTVKPENVTIKSIQQYINNNFSDPNFSLQTLAGYFGMSMSNLSHYFKSHTGISLFDYLTEKKIAYIKELLVTTDDTINDIVQKMGYMHPSNFIKKFKNIVGMTPGKYRETYKFSQNI